MISWIIAITELTKVGGFIAEEKRLPSIQCWWWAVHTFVTAAPVDFTCIPVENTGSSTGYSVWLELKYIIIRLQKHV